MNTGKTVFAQLLEYLPQHQSRRCVNRYKGNYKVQSFTCLDLTRKTVLFFASFHLLV
ncbi:DUF4372 domain-containing protein [Pelodictyon luteolum]|uniref:DUF4372 domain-containing protein n=1 Tax=Pelodictyon luteolum TaxID=1100 RepID=UPI0009D69E02|nr:DUF4372 domain-containing protein [Pelodictyon luteolum]